MLETGRWNIQDRFDSREAIVAYLDAAFEDGDPDLIAAAIEDVARASGLSLPRTPTLREVLEALKAAGVGLTARAA
jgi:membrane protein involved in colicin uptake